jgi:predicted RNA binding protein YcfA (HicA-like mRNA interferase family)
MPTIRSHEVEKVLARLGASVCVTAGSWHGFDHAE